MQEKRDLVQPKAEGKEEGEQTEKEELLQLVAELEGKLKEKKKQKDPVRKPSKKSQSGKFQLELCEKVATCKSDLVVLVGADKADELMKPTANLQKRLQKKGEAWEEAWDMSEILARKNYIYKYIKFSIRYLILSNCIFERYCIEMYFLKGIF